MKPIWTLKDNILEKNIPFNHITLYTKTSGIIKNVPYIIKYNKVYFDMIYDNIILEEDNKCYLFNINKKKNNNVDFYVKSYYKNNTVYFDIELSTSHNHEYIINITGDITRTIILQPFNKHVSFKHVCNISIEHNFNLFFNGVNKLHNVINMDIFPTKMTYHNNRISFNKNVPCKMKINDIDVCSGINYIDYSLKNEGEHILKYKDIVILKEYFYIDKDIEMKILTDPLRIKLSSNPTCCEIKFKQYDTVIQLKDIETIIPIKNKGYIELDLEYAYGIKCNEKKWKFLF